VAILASRVLGVVRDAIFARVFGVSGLTDAYVAAFRIPNLLRDLFAEGALSSAFVPTFSDVLNRGGQERAYRLGNLVVGAVLAVTGVLTLGGMLFSDQLISLISRGFGGNAAQVALGGLFAQIMMPILTMVSVSAVWMGMLNAQHHYTAPAYAPAMFNVTSILCGLGLLIARPSERTGMIVWSAGTALAGLMQAVVQLPSLWRLGYRVRPTLAGLWRDSDLRRIVRLMGPATLGLAAVQINIFVNTQFAAALGSGPLTYLQNAFRLFYLPVGLFGVALATVTTARASQEAARGDRPALQARVAEGARGVWLLALPSAVGLIVLARPVVELLFQGGKFSAANTAATVPIVQAYMLGVLPYSLVKVLSPAFFAIDRTRVPMMASLASVAVNLVFNGLTYRRLGAAGLALGTTVGALANLAVLRLWFGQVVGQAPRLARWSEILRLILGNLVLAFVAVGAWWLGALLLDHAGIAWPWGTRRLVHAILLFTTIGCGFVSYGLALKFLRASGADELWEVPKRIWAKLRGRR
jgi:putative peptidoglycan lipid II flippase